ncbi:MAG: zf-HC2 domain-containing protein [Acidobacteria bacterium]|nr:zf-HC2 domain-containing protein [Acidobacteriota bacterium]
MRVPNPRHPDELISALFDGELAPEEWAEVKEHLEGCERCRRLLEQIKSISSAMPADPPRITFPLAAGAGLAATLIVGALLIQYMPASVTSRLRLPALSAEEPAEGPSETSAEREEKAAIGKDTLQAVPPASGTAGESEMTEARPGAVPAGSPEERQDMLVLPPEPKAEGAAPSGLPQPSAAPPSDYAATGERPGLAPDQQLPVTVPEEADELARTADQIALDQTRSGPVGGIAAPVPAAGNEAPSAEQEPARQRAAADAAASAPAARAGAPAPPPAEALRDQAPAAPVPSATSVAACQATWSSPRQAFWPQTAGRNPERVVGGAGQSAGGRSILMESPRRVRITVPRDRWPDLLQRLAAAGVTGTAQLPAPPEWADCAALNVSMPEAPGSPPAPPPARDAPVSPPPAR